MFSDCVFYPSFQCFIRFKINCLRIRSCATRARNLRQESAELSRWCWRASWLAMKLLALIQCLLVVTRSLTTRPSIPSGFAVVARSVLPAASPAAPVVQHLLTLWPERFATVSAGQHSPHPHLCAPHRLRTASAPPLRHACCCTATAAPPLLLRHPCHSLRLGSQEGMPPQARAGGRRGRPHGARGER